MKVKKENIKKYLFRTILLILVIIVLSQIISKKININKYKGELAKAMTYEQFIDGDEVIEGTEFVTFSSFFLRDLNGDGYAEKIKGTCKEIGSEDTLYMELIVQTEGYLKNRKNRNSR